jgi:uncharacterized protein (DUF1499 family)
MSEVELKSSPNIKWIWWVFILLFLTSTIWLGFRIIFPDRSTIFAGTRPSNLGVSDRQLVPCPDTPNCISSQSEDPEHRIEPLSYGSSKEQAIKDLKQILQQQERVKIISETDNYLYAEFTSRWMGFIDDVEFYVDEENQKIDVRSASRLGESDLGANRQRIETIRSEFNKRLFKG